MTESLKKFLVQNLAEILEEKAIVVSTPGELEPPSDPKLILFLSSFEENNYLRNTEPEREKNQKVFPPLVVDFSYHLIPYAREREKEWMILEKLLQVFHDTKILQKDVLTEELVKSGNDSIKITSFKMGLEEFQALQKLFIDKRYRLIASYTVSPIKIPSLRVQEFKEIKKRATDVSKME